MRKRQTRASQLVLSVLLAASLTSLPAGAQTRAGAAAATPPPAWSGRWPSLAPAVASGGMVASTDRVASEIGAEILRRGGNAVDAAVATHFALAVVNPEAGNLGGGGFMVARVANGTTASLDFREVAPLRATRDMFLDAQGNPTNRSLEGHLASGVPGSVAGMWEAHRRFGSLPWADLVAPAVALADGIVVHARLAESLQEYAARFRQYPASAAIFLREGRAPRVGERLVQADLAATLRRIASGGKEGFYRGRTAELLEEEMRRGNGLITREDLARYDAKWRDPLRFDYRGYQVISMPPPSSGGATLAEMLNIMEGYDLRAAGYLSTRHAHLFAEAAKRAYADRNTYLADPDFIPQPTARMISEAYAAERRSSIRLDRATPSEAVRPGLGPTTVAAIALTARPEGEHTTHYSVVDAAGNAVAVTTTLNSLYGSRVLVTGAGFFLNNEMDDFTAKPGTANQFGLVQGAANAVAPGKRMLSAMTPTIVLSPEGRLRLVTGSPGGPTIITTVAQVISNVVDWGMDLPAAVGAPRLHHQHLPDRLYYEHDGLAPATAAALRALGQAPENRAGYQGDAASILLRPDGLLVGVADPRRGGAAVGVEGAAKEVVR
ncbi:MAG: gamma-glutamyltransferase [Gemmatimonadetes bacterium]|nr:gamma-glutamyltransferase [Gemmatimonadota bacterium]